MTKEELDTVKTLNDALHVVSSAMKDVNPTEQRRYAYDCAMKALSRAMVQVDKLTNISCTHCDGTGKVSIYA